MPRRSLKPLVMTETPEAPRAGERIAKLLARAGIASRREIERMIAEGRVKLDGTVLTTPATVLESLRGVTVDDQPVSAPEAARLFAFHKPSGLITAERDPAGRPTIYNALRNALPADAPRVMPVGRLDLNTEGLLLLTNDGALKRALELPSSGIERTYRARTFGDISQAQLEELIEGVEIDGVRYGKIDANMERRTGRNQWIELTLTEGKNREVRRVLEHLGLQVSRLLRISYGPVRLGDLPRGMAGEVDGKVVDELLRQLKVAAPGDVTPRRKLAPKAEAPAPAPAAKRARPARGAATVRPRPVRPAQSETEARPEGPREVRNLGPAKPGARRGAPQPRPASGRNPRGERTTGADLREDRGSGRTEHGTPRAEYGTPRGRGKPYAEERREGRGKPYADERREGRGTRDERDARETGRTARPGPRSGASTTGPGGSRGERPDGKPRGRPGNRPGNPGPRKPRA